MEQQTLTSKAVTITVNNFKFQAKTWGDPSHKNRVLAIHGWLDNANTFDKIAPSISQNCYLVAIDLAGHGLSDHRANNGNYYLWDYAIDILNCLDALGWKTSSILAHSLGTGVASLIAGAFPKRVHKLVFIDGLGAPFVADENVTVSNFKKAFLQLKMAKKTSLYGFSNENEAVFNSKEVAIKDRVNNIISEISYDAASILVDRGLKPVNKGYRWTHDPKIVLPAHFKMTEAQVTQFLKSISCETLIILGKQGLFADGLFKDRIQSFTNATIHWIDGNHHLHLEAEHNKISTLINQFYNN